MINRRFIFAVIAILSLCLTSCVREIENGSLLTIKGFIDPINQNEVESSQLFLIGIVTYQPVDASGDQLEIKRKYFSRGPETQIELSPDFHYEVNVIVKDYLKKVKSLTPLKVDLKIQKINGNIITTYPLDFENDGIQVGLTPGTYQVKALDITL